jgi:hypothetical protein
MHKLDAISCLEWRLSPIRARHNVTILFQGNAIGTEAKALDQRCHRDLTAKTVNRALGPVQHNENAVCHN